MMRKRIIYSQNFSKSKELVSRLIKKSTIGNQDLVYEIGAGQGIITEELLKKAQKVVAFEIDKNLFNKLAERFQGNRFLELRLGDFLTQSLPTYPYKVFSNIPFNITSVVIKKLTQAQNPPDDVYLIVQKEAARKFIGKPYDNKNSQIAILLKPWFELEIFYNFRQDDFFPRPNVDIVMLRIVKREKGLIDNKNRELYQDFVVYTFNQTKPNITEGLAKIFGKQNIIKMAKKLNFCPGLKPSDLGFQKWLRIFEIFLNKTNKNQQSLVKGSFKKQLLNESRMGKIFRTRLDKKWRNKKLN